MRDHQNKSDCLGDEYCFVFAILAGCSWFSHHVVWYPSSSLLLSDVNCDVLSYRVSAEKEATKFSATWCWSFRPDTSLSVFNNSSSHIERTKMPHLYIIIIEWYGSSAAYHRSIAWSKEWKQEVYGCVRYRRHEEGFFGISFLFLLLLLLFGPRFCFCCCATSAAAAAVNRIYNGVNADVVIICRLVCICFHSSIHYWSV